MQTTLSISLRASLRLKRFPFDFAAILLLLLLTTWLIILLSWRFWYASRIYGGVSVAGVPIGGLTRARALGQLSTNLQNYPLPPVNLSYGRQQWPLTSDRIKAQMDLMTAVNRAYLIGRQGNLAERTFRQLVAGLWGHDLTPSFMVDIAQLRYTIGQVAKEVRRPGRAASQIGTMKVAAQPGLDVDVEATLQTVLKALQIAKPNQIINVPLSVIELVPAALPISSVRGNETTTAPKPLRLQDTKFNLQLALDRVTINRLVVSTKPPQLDEDGLRAVLNTWAAQLTIPTRDARLHFDPATQAVTVVQSSQSGRTLDIEATLRAIQQAVRTGQQQAALVMVEERPVVDINNISSMGIRELVASGVSYFKGSAPERVHNIEVGAAKLADVVIPPDQIFSFDKYVEDVTSANGFEDSLIIWGDQTATGAGGGICQVSTTVFRAAYTGGLAIVERYNHGYVVAWYGEPGMDATIFSPTVDFRFRNDTNAYLLIEPVVDSTNGVITINFYGTKPNRQVQIKPPVQSDVQEPEPPQYKVDETLAKGQTKQVEFAHNGMNVSVERVITEGGTTYTDTLISQYQPWRAVFLVGPGTELPNRAPPVTPAR